MGGVQGMTQTRYAGSAGSYPPVIYFGRYDLRLPAAQLRLVGLRQLPTHADLAGNVTAVLQPTETGSR
jgi:hypothetical protein